MRAFTWFRRSEVGIALLVVTSSLALVYADVGHVVDLTAEERMQQLINNRRATAGIGRLVIGPYLVDYAEYRARVMRNRQRLEPHDPCFLCGEVLGATTDGPWSIFVAWMNSDVHRHVLMLPGITRLGCGAVRDARGRLWLACEVRY